jgi:hypothetical protein
MDTRTLVGTSVDGEDIRGRLRRQRREIDLLEAAFARDLRRMIEARAFRLDGYPDPIAWLKVECRMSPGAAAERVLVAEQLSRLTEAEAALTSGRIGYQQAAIIAHSAASVAPEDAERVSLLTLSAATQMDTAQFRQAARAIVAEVDHEAIERDARRNWTRRRLSLRIDRDGGFVVDGILDPECGARLSGQLDALMGRRGAEDDRTPEQRRHDALAEILKLNERAERHPGSGSSRPNLEIRIPLSALGGDGGPPAMLNGLTPLTRKQLERSLCDAVAYTSVVDAQGRAHFAGRRTRTFSGSKRRRLMATQDSCNFPGCDRPSAWCDAHHVDAYAEGGQTMPENGALLCAFHHHLVHEGGWSLQRGDLTGWTAVRPDGTFFRTSSGRTPPAASQNSP